MAAAAAAVAAVAAEAEAEAEAEAAEAAEVAEVADATGATATDGQTAPRTHGCTRQCLELVRARERDARQLRFCPACHTASPATTHFPTLFFFCLRRVTCAHAHMLRSGRQNDGGRNSGGGGGAGRGPKFQGIMPPPGAGIQAPPPTVCCLARGVLPMARTPTRCPGAMTAAAAAAAAAVAAAAAAAAGKQAASGV